MEQTPQILPYNKARDFKNVVALFAEEHRQLYPTTQKGDADCVVEHLFSPENTFVCKTPSNFVGFINFCCMPAASYCCGIWNVQAKYSINYIAVGGTFRKQGYGEMLMNHALNIMAKEEGIHKKIDTFTLNTNIAATALLTKSGFRCSSDSRSAHVLYTKTLSSLTCLAQKKAQ